MAAIEWPDVSQLDPLASAVALGDAVTALGESTLSWGGEWVPSAPGGPLLLGVVMMMLVANLALAWRWRAVARLNGAERTIR